jgi:two-component system phosphate regulon sensor histidine kinase PhoR
VAERVVRWGLGAKLFTLSVALIGVCVVVADAVVSSQVDAYVTHRIEGELVVRASAAAREAEHTTAPLDDTIAWDDVADAMGRTLRARITVVRSDGTVVGDSEVPQDALGRLENHASREEIAQAMSGNGGTSTRLSRTLGERMMYVAVPFKSGGRVVGVARAAMPLTEVDEAIRQVRRIVWIASALGVLVASGLSGLVARRISAVVGALIEAAKKMTKGDLSVRTQVRGKDELAELGHSLDDLAASLSTTLAQLRAERDLQRRILVGMQEGVLVLDDQARVVLMNPALREMLLLGAEAQGQLLLEVLRHAELHELVERAPLAQGPVSGEIEVTGIKPRRLLVHAAALEGPRGGLVAVFVDVTDLRRLETLRRDFVANVSHELRTPVAAVRSATETLREGAVKDEGAAERFLGIIDRNAQRLQALIEDLLELSRLDAKEYRLRIEPVDLSSAAAIVMGLFRERAEKKGLRMEAKLPEPCPVLETDQRALEQILGNLVDNAIKYCPAGASVTLRVAEDHEGIRLSVEDTGPGIAAKHLPRLFERFYRVDAGRSREVGGTGLGLSIVKHLVEALGGSITVTSEPGRGSTFSVAFSREPASAA